VRWCCQGQGVAPLGPKDLYLPLRDPTTARVDRCRRNLSRTAPSINAYLRVALDTKEQRTSLLRY
jgi:hypothetical protein